jgi:hypothetical protein
MDWRVSEASSEAHAETSIVWLLAWALVLPFAHLGRLLTYGFFAFVLLIALTVLYPEGSVFAPILVSSNFDPQPPPVFLPHSQALGLIVLALSGLTIAFLVCVWQRDIVHHFRDPIGPLLTTSAGRLLEHLIASLLLAVFLIGFAGLLLTAGPVGVGVGCLVLAPIYARLAFLGPVIVSQGLKAAVPLAWRAGRGHSVGHAMILALLGLCWFGILFAMSATGVKAATQEHNLLPLLLADCSEVAVTFFFVLWIAAVPALIVRRRIVLQEIDDTVFD